jgi:hypothetical protein
MVFDLLINLLMSRHLIMTWLDRNIRVVLYSSFICTVVNMIQLPTPSAPCHKLQPGEVPPRSVNTIAERYCQRAACQLKYMLSWALKNKLGNRLWPGMPTVSGHVPLPQLIRQPPFIHAHFDNPPDGMPQYLVFHVIL